MKVIWYHQFHYFPLTEPLRNWTGEELDETDMFRLLLAD